MEDCIFCKIIKGDIPSYTIYEDDLVKAFLDVNPNTNGHTLLIPKNHYKDISEIPDAVISHSFTIIKEKLYPLLKEKLNCSGLTICQNNEYGQEVKHYHIHLIPRYENDNLEVIANKEILDSVENTYSNIV